MDASNDVDRLEEDVSVNNRCQLQCPHCLISTIDLAQHALTKHSEIYASRSEAAVMVKERKAIARALGENIIVRKSELMAHFGDIPSDMASKVLAAFSAFNHEIDDDCVWPIDCEDVAGPSKPVDDAMYRESMGDIEIVSESEKEEPDFEVNEHDAFNLRNNAPRGREFVSQIKTLSPIGAGPQIATHPIDAVVQVVTQPIDAGRQIATHPIDAVVQVVTQPIDAGPQIATHPIDTKPTMDASNDVDRLVEDVSVYNRWRLQCPHCPISAIDLAQHALTKHSEIYASRSEAAVMVKERKAIARALANIIVRKSELMAHFGDIPSDMASKVLAAFSAFNHEIDDDCVWPIDCEDVAGPSKPVDDAMVLASDEKETELTL
ncbi:hypothetical protein CAPTEDRAFT_190207 [Capitella teleta]|uniref:Uncharacterized protein n=1 Tax=Capitella teleta TaxID=283909 RepID=R7UP02_CAPTE|nr:hypothetical protein CAPTEDRAFT_190207 [Capitella teleta]|eukprot:ELU07843.1 hypothetical protein CAPTEDRAFT_190207 [Capitella teleta]